MHEKTTLVRFLKKCKDRLFAPEQMLPRDCYKGFSESSDDIATANATKNRQGLLVIFDNLRILERQHKIEKG